MRLVDLRVMATSSAPTVAVRASAGAEMLRMIGVLLDDGPDPDHYDVGRARIDNARATVPPDLLGELRNLGFGSEKSWLVMANAAAWLEEPGGVDELLAMLEMDPGLPWRVLLAHHVAEESGIDLDAVRRAVEGDGAAVDQLRGLVTASETPSGIRPPIDIEPDEHGRRLLGALERFRATTFGAYEAEALGAIGRDVAYRRQQLDSGVPVDEVVLAATNGYELEAGIEQVLLLPSFWMRPWLVIGRLSRGEHDLEVISTPVADEFLCLPSEAPPPMMLKTFKALADEGRLKLLRRMAGGPISLGEAAEELDVAKATAHHHLSLLRQAGLVSLRGEGRNTRFALRGQPSRTAAEQLSTYLGGR